MIADYEKLQSLQKPPIDSNKSHLTKFKITIDLYLVADSSSRRYEFST